MLALFCLHITDHDQPPAYPHNDTPPDYHDVCPRNIVSPSPVDIPPPDNTPAVYTVRITITNDTGTSPAVSSSSNTTTVTRYPPENIVVTQPPTHNSHLYQVSAW